MIGVVTDHSSSYRSLESLSRVSSGHWQSILYYIILSVFLSIGPIFIIADHWESRLPARCMSTWREQIDEGIFDCPAELLLILLMSTYTTSTFYLFIFKRLGYNIIFNLRPRSFLKPIDIWKTRQKSKSLLLTGGNLNLKTPTHPACRVRYQSVILLMFLCVDSACTLLSLVIVNVS